jgi:hypothetical protein
MRVDPRFLLAVLPLLLTGCALSPTASPTPAAGPTIAGHVHGGQQPLSNAHVFLFAANTTGYGNPSLSLLSSVPGSTAQDTTPASPTFGDFYTTTDPTGAFSLTNDYTCAAGQQVYLYVSGGDAGGGNNAASGLLAILGNCPGGDSAFAATIPSININEATTIAAAFAFAGFATDATHVSSSGTPLAAKGIAAAFANATNLVQLSSGQVRSVTAFGNGTAPAAEIGTLANILAACVNTSGAVTGPTSPSACYTLFTNATADGTSTGTQPTETATAALNIAHHPGSNITALYGLPVATPPFLPNLTAQPNDFTVSLMFTNAGSYDLGVAVDADDNIWFGNGASLVELRNDGKLLSSSTGYSTHALPLSIAIDTAGNVWAGNANGLVARINPDGTAAPGSPFAVPGGASLFGSATLGIDANGNVWSGAHRLATELDTSGTQIATFNVPSVIPHETYQFSEIAISPSGTVWISDFNDSIAIVFMTDSSGTFANPNGLPIAGGSGPMAIDAAGHLWVDGSNGQITELNPDGSPAPGSPFSGGGQPLNADVWAIALDGAGNVWTANCQNDPSGLTEFSNAGVPLSPSTQFHSPYLHAPFGIAIDGAGNIWTPDASQPAIIEFVGAAVPVVTPIAAGVAHNTLATRP